MEWQRRGGGGVEWGSRDIWSARGGQWFVTSSYVIGNFLILISVHGMACRWRAAENIAGYSGVGDCG